MSKSELFYLYATIDLTTQHYKVLLLLLEGERTQTQISNELDQKRQNVNRTCRYLESIGLITRLKIDGRNVYFKIVTEPNVQLKGQMRLL